MTTETPNVLPFYPAAPMNGGKLDESTPDKIGAWGWEPKVDDWRGALHLPSGTVWNQYGKPSSLAEKGKVAQAIADIQHRVGILSTLFDWLDIGIMEARHDMMRGSIIVFDVMGTPLMLRERRHALESLFPTLPPATVILAAGNVQDRVYLINQWREVQHPLFLQNHLMDENKEIGRKFYEGLVAKRLASLYPACSSPKCKTADWIKHRFDQP